MSAGVLNAKQVKDDLLSGESPAIKIGSFKKADPDASSIDLPLGEKYWPLKASIRPSKNQKVIDVIQQISAASKELRPRTVLKRNCVYLVELGWPELSLPKHICARATAKSSVGRLDVLVRLVTDCQPEFDRVSLGASTRMYVEIVPLTFDIFVSPGMSLSQLRFIRGEDNLCLVTTAELKCEIESPLVSRNGSEALLDSQGDVHSVLLSLDASPDPALGFSGFRAKNEGELSPVDPSLRKPKPGETDQRPVPSEYWDPVSRDSATQGILIEKDRFYILRSKERFRIPAHYAVECQAYAESLGDIRIHYAGFAHPYFGLDRKEGTPLIFEVRGFSMNTILRDGAPLAKVNFRRMSKDAEKEGAENSYSKQELNLSACFREWE